MPSNSIEYFYKIANIDPNDVYGYFDFDYSGISGLTTIPSKIFQDNEVFLKINSLNNNVWKFSGCTFFDKSSYLEYSGFNDFSFTCAIAFSRDEEKDSIIFSTLGGTEDNYSGFNVGINAYGYGFVEYKDNYYGNVAVLNTDYRYQKTGIIFIDSDINFCSIGSFLNKNNFVNSTCIFNQNGYKPSYNKYFGGNPIINSEYNLSGKIYEIILQDRGFSNYNPSATLSGFLYSAEKIISTGFISGQTGVIYGDIIYVSGCEYVIFNNSQEEPTSLLNTGVIEFFSSESEFRDFNNDIYHDFVIQTVTGVLSSGSLNDTNQIALSCFTEVTGYNSFNISSGYVIEYRAESVIPSIKRPEYLLKYSNGILFLYPSIQSGKLNYFKINYGEILNNYYNFDSSSTPNALTIDEEITNDNLDLYFNGQLQRPSDVYSVKLISGQKYFTPNNDYFRSGISLYNNSIYNSNIHNFIGYLNPQTEFYYLTGKYTSGSDISGINLQNSLIYLNGLLLYSGIDYNGNNILFDISGDNILAKQSLAGLIYQNNIFDIIPNNVVNINTGFFIENTSMVWLNGIRMSLGHDYLEKQGSIYSNQFIESMGILIYNDVI